MSIFTKDCPVCAANHPVHAVRCNCGYRFDPNKIDGVTQELEVISQEEQLYRDYLAARADQAEKAMQSAKAAVAYDHANTVRVAEALLAEQTAMSARAEFDAQDQRAKAVKNRIKVVRASRRARRVAKAAASPSRPAPVSVREVLAPKSTPAVQLPAAPTPAPIPSPVPTAVAAPSPAVKIEPPKPKIVAPMPAPPKPVALNPQAVAPPAPAKQLIASKPAPARPAPAPAMQDKPTPTFRTNQAHKATHLYSSPAKSNSIDCPNCSAKVAPNAARCRCGFEMPHSASQIPSLNMSPEDRAAFLAALAPIHKDHGG